jgi:transcriptional regulator with XRE-family HTH domain
MSDLVKFLKEKLAEIQKKSPAYSQRAYAKKLGISSGTLSEIFAGKRKITPSLAEKIAQRLEFTPYERKAAGLAVDDEGRRTLKQFPVNEGTLAMIPNWWNFAIVAMIGIPEYQSSAAAIAKRLRLSKREVDESLALLERVGLIAKENGRWKKTNRRILIDTPEAAAAIDNTFDQDAKLIKKSFEEVHPTLRCDIVATFAIDAAKLPKLKKMVFDFVLNEFLLEAESKKPDEIYKLVLHCFPLTKQKKEGG